jgi:peptidoglycan hydrolase-like protein with peptidoglycan-binding domain
MIIAKAAWRAVALVAVIGLNLAALSNRQSWAQAPTRSPGDGQGASSAALTAFSADLKSFTGRWSDGNCAVRWNDWSTSGLDITFHDQSGGIDVERVIDLQPSGFVTQALVVSHGAQPSRWRYQPAPPDGMRVQNLSTGTKFFLRRCPLPATPVQTRPSLPRPPDTQSRIGPSFDCTQARDALSALICASDTLSWTDMRFSQAYQALRQQVGEAGQPAIRQEAIDFQVQIYAECRLPKAGLVAPPLVTQAEACVTRGYQGQREIWASRLSGPLQEEANRPLPLHIQLQATLQKLGYLPPTSTVDGVYGPATRAAISAWQITNNLSPTGALSASDAQRLLQSPLVPPPVAPSLSASTTAGPPAAPTPAILPPSAAATPATPSATIPLPEPRAAPVENAPPNDEAAKRASDERQLAVSLAEAAKARAEAQKAQAEAEKAQADADRARAEAQVLAAKEKEAAEARLKAATQARAEQDAHGIQP